MTTPAERIAATMRNVFTLPGMQRALRTKAEACRKLARQKRAAHLSTDAVNWQGLADELESEADALQWWLEPASPPPFTENEVKDVLTALYQDGHVDLVLADRVAALMKEPLVASPPAPRTWTGYSPRLLREAGIQVEREFYVRDAVTNECRLMTDAEWDADMLDEPKR